MPKAGLAEWILSLAVSPEQAAAITGDLLEREADRGSFWFWFTVCRTVFSIPARNLSAQPVDIWLVALKGLGFLFLWDVMFLLAYVIVNAVIPSPAAREMVLWGMMWLCVPLFQFGVGCAVARRSASQELSAWLAVAVLESALNVMVIVSRTTGWMMIPMLFASVTLYQIPAFIGVARIRRRNLIHLDHSPTQGTH